MTGITWIILGLVLIGIELAAPTYLFFLALGISAILVGAGFKMGLLTTQAQGYLAFTVLAALDVVPLWFVGKKLRLKRGPMPVSEYVGQEGTIERVLAGGVCTVRVGREEWSAKRQEPKDELQTGDRVLVTRVEGVHLVVIKRRT